MSISQSQFCALIGKLNTHSAAPSISINASLYGINRLASTIQLAHGQLVADAKNLIPKGLLLPVDTNLYTELIAVCPGLLPALPADAATASLAVSALQALLTAQSPQDMLNTMLGNPVARLAKMRATVQGVVKMVEAVLQPPTAIPPIPSITGTVAKAAGQILVNQASALASRAVSDAVGKVGINPVAAKRCADRLCATGSRWAPPG